MRKKLVLIVIDGLTPAMLEHAVESVDVPALRFLMESGEYRRAVTTFPSLTPVCLSSIATGAHPDVHGIPHLVWYHRGEERLVEYGSSFSAIRAAGTTRAIRDAIFGMNEEHLSRAGRDRVRGARGRRAGDGRGEHGLLPRAGAARPDGALAHEARLRPNAVLLLQPLRVGRDRCAARHPHACQGLGRRVRAGRGPLARHAGRLRLPRLLPP